MHGSATARRHLRISTVACRGDAAGDLAIAGRVHRALATEYVYSGKPLAEAIAHGREAAIA